MKGIMRNFSGWLFSSFGTLILISFCVVGFAQEKNNLPASQTAVQDASPANVPPAPSPTFDQVVGKIVEREHLFVAQMRHFHPLVETYIQNLKGDEEAAVPVSDQYFLGRLDMTNGTEDSAFKSQSGFGRRFVAKLTSIYGMNFCPLVSRRWFCWTKICSASFTNSLSYAANFWAISAAW